MIKTHKDFIGIYENALSDDACDFVISEFENHLLTNPSDIQSNSRQFERQEFGRMDEHVFANMVLPKSSSVINECLSNCMKEYAEEYFSIKQIKARSEEVKLQKTKPRGGYHVWHSEVANRQTMSRVLTWIVYLNDVSENEGETEFLWQGLRVAPKKGKCVIWPAQFTHPHRGNPVYSCNKYIATGWYTYTD